MGSLVIFESFKIKPYNMPEYKPALNEAENQRVSELMEKLKRVQDVEDQIKKELRKLIYKADSR